MSINYQLTFNQGYEAGQRLYARFPSYRVAQLREEAEREADRQDLPMIMRVHYKDGLIAGYKPKQESETENDKRPHFTKHGKTL